MSLAEDLKLASKLAAKAESVRYVVRGLEDKKRSPAEDGPRLVSIGPWGDRGHVEVEASDSLLEALAHHLGEYADSLEERARKLAGQEPPLYRGGFAPVRYPESKP